LSGKIHKWGTKVRRRLPCTEPGRTRGVVKWGRGRVGYRKAHGKLLWKGTGGYGVEETGGGITSRKGDTS